MDKKKERKRFRPWIKITWDRILTLVVLIMLLPGLYNQHCLARSRSVRMEILLNSEGLGYYLGEKISRRELGQLDPSWQCIGGSFGEVMADIPWGWGFFTRGTKERDPRWVYAISVKKFSGFFSSSFYVTQMDLGFNHFKIYDIIPEMNRKEAAACLEKHGYYNRYGMEEYWKGDVSIQLEISEERVYGLILRLYRPTERRMIQKAYEQRIKNAADSYNAK